MIEDNLIKVKNNISLSLAKSNRKENVTLLLASKMVSSEKLNLLSSKEQLILGENKTNELVEKYGVVKNVTWHFIGALQTNKVKYIIDKVALIHSVDRVSLIDEIDKQAKKHNLVMDILLEVNIGREEAKSGVLVEDFPSLLSYAMGKSNIRVLGLMTVMPKNADKKLYMDMRNLFDTYKDKCPTFKYLSMGMSGDYQIAIENGSNLVRIGSAVFGQRNYNAVEVNNG